MKSTLEAQIDFRYLRPVSFKIITERAQLRAYTDSIREAADSERNSFGFLPPDAYREFVEQRRAVAAVTESGDLIGYSLFGGAGSQAKIFQTYVSPNYRGHSVGTHLLKSVFSRLENSAYLSVVANVSSHLDIANQFYEKIGFDVIRIKQAKTKNRHINVRARELSNPSLLDQLAVPSEAHASLAIGKPRQHSIPRYVLDLNVIFDVTKDRQRTAVAQEVIQAGLEKDVRLAITSEALAELEKHTRSDRPDPILQFCRGFPILKIPSLARMGVLRSALLPMVFPEKAHPENLKPNDESDLRHLATAIEECSEGFVTSDEAILRASENIQLKFGLQVLSPAAFGQSFEFEFGAPSQALVRNSFSTMQPTRFVDEDDEQVRALLSSYDLSELRVRKILARGTAKALRRREVVRTDSGILSFASWDPPKPNGEIRGLSVFADESNPNASTAIKYMLERASRDLGENEVGVFNLAPHIRQDLLRRVALIEGFYIDEGTSPRNPELKKASFGAAFLPATWDAASRRIANAIGVEFSGSPSLMQTLSLTDAKGVSRFISLSGLEDLLSPVIIATDDRPGVVLPIWPNYAEELFQGAQQLSFLEQSEASIKPEKAYIGGNYGSIPEGGLAFFYESEKQNGRKAIIAVARVLARYLLDQGEAAAVSKDRGVLPEEAIENQGGRRLKTVIDIGSIMLFKKPVTLKRLRQMGCADGANFVTSKVIEPKHCIQLIAEGEPKIG